MICPHCKKEIKPKPRKKVSIKRWDILDVEYVLACDITNFIMSNHPSLKENLSTEHYRQKATQAISDCMVKHGYEINIILEICEWVCSDPFWKKQFQAVPKLTRKDNGSTGLTLKWIHRFENEMKKDGRRSFKSIKENFEFTNTVTINKL